METFRNNRGQRHRVGGPAVIYDDGMQSWYINGKLHRDNGPAIYLSHFRNVDDNKNHYEPYHVFENYYRYGKRHRLDGPAVITKYGPNEWWLNGVQYSEEEHRVKVRNLKLKNLKF